MLIQAVLWLMGVLGFATCMQVLLIVRAQGHDEIGQNGPQHHRERLAADRHGCN
jgi:hypothetical protein